MLTTDEACVYDVLREQLPQLSNRFLLDRTQATSKYGDTTWGEQQPLDAAIIVQEASELHDIVALANREALALYVISSGNNWGYGSFQSRGKARSLLLDLSQLQKITPIDKTLGLISLEPGVTQQMLFDYLQREDWPYMVPVTGAGPECSILGNALERGYGITPYTDHFGAITQFKTILPHPDLCRKTLVSAVDELDLSGQDFIDKSYKYGLGPYLDGLFTQSNLGLVTECCVRLKKRPECICGFFIPCHRQEGLEDAIAFTRQLLQDYEGIVGAVNVMDRRRCLSMQLANPNDPQLHQVMTEQQVSELAERVQAPHWMIVGSLYGAAEVVKVVKKQVRRLARGIGKPIFSDALRVKLVSGLLRGKSFDSGSTHWWSKQGQRLTLRLSGLEEVVAILSGEPKQTALPLAYWRNPFVHPDKRTALRPDKDACGLYWYAPLIPAHPEKITRFVDFIRQTTPEFGIEPLITLTSLRHDCIDATVPVLFNASDPQACQQARLCLDTLMERGRALGFVPYRLTSYQQALMDSQSSYWQTLEKIKRALDPNLILNPGRYHPSNQ